MDNLITGNSVCERSIIKGDLDFWERRLGLRFKFGELVRVWTITKKQSCLGSISGFILCFSVSLIVIADADMLSAVSTDKLGNLQESLQETKDITEWIFSKSPRTQQGDLSLLLWLTTIILIHEPHIENKNHTILKIVLEQNFSFGRLILCHSYSFILRSGCVCFFVGVCV